MSGKDNAPIIIKKVVKGGGEGHHGGAWKVAYADFVTAMMAFFLLMWLLNATTEKQRKGIADYFDPSIPLARISAGGDNVLMGDSVVSREERSGSRKPEPDPDRKRELLQKSADDPAQGTDASAEDLGEAPEYAQAYRAEQSRLEGLADGVRAAVSDAGPGLDEHFMVRLTPEGLVIEIVDTGDAPLFASGSARPEAKLVTLMEVIVPILELTANPVAVVGHTDSSPFSRAGYDNWALSADRANSARRLMRAVGMPEERFARVSGRAATEPLSEDPRAPENRRIAITLLRDVGR